MDFGPQVSRSFGTLREMLADRATSSPEMYAVAAQELLAVTAADLARLSLQHAFLLPLASEEERGADAKLRVLYMLHPKFRIADVKRVLDGRSNVSTTVVLITLDKPSSTHLRNLKVFFPKLQVFQLTELLYNVTKHHLVPKHEVVDEAEVNEIMGKFNLKSKQQLPHISVSDPVARYLALRPGTVIRVTRPSPSAGMYVSYRCCV